MFLIAINYIQFIIRNAEHWGVCIHMDHYLLSFGRNTENQERESLCTWTTLIQKLEGILIIEGNTLIYTVTTSNSSNETRDIKGRNCWTFGQLLLIHQNKTLKFTSKQQKSGLRKIHLRGIKLKLLISHINTSKDKERRNKDTNFVLK